MIWQFQVAVVCYILLFVLIMGARFYEGLWGIPNKAAKRIGVILILVTLLSVILILWGIIAT
jgi:uncharacterized Tic20 family protein